MFLQEIRHAFRMLVRSPGLTTVAALSLGLGIGFNTAMFSFHDAIMWRPLPVREPGSVVTLRADRTNDQSIFGGRISYPNYRDLRESSQSFDGFVAHTLTTVSFARSREAVRDMRMGMLVSDNFFEVLGIQPILGRRFTPEEGQVRGRDAVAVLGYDFWKNTLGEDRSIIGGVLLLNGIDFTVVGVAPESFTGMDPYIRPAFYAPLMMAERLSTGRTNLLDDRAAASVVVKGRLKPSVSQRSAQAELTTIWNGLVQEYPNENRDRTMAVLTEMQERMRDEPANAVIVPLITALVALVLVIACANVANLLLGRARARSREIAIRLALGVGRMRLLRQLLIESILLASIGGTLGLVFAYGGIRFISSTAQSVVQTDLPVVVEPQLDFRVVLFSLFATLASAALFGLAPSWQSLKAELVPALKSSEPGRMNRQRTIGRNVLVSAQIAISVVLLVAAGMMVTGVRNTLGTNPGFRTDHLITMATDTSLVRYTPAQTRNFYRDLVDGARGLPDVRSVTLASSIPFDGDSTRRETVIPEGYQFPQGQKDVSILSAAVDESYFDVLRIEIVRGRTFTAADNDLSHRVAIVNEAFAQRFWPNQDPLGKRIRLGDDEGPWLEVVGLTKTGKYQFIAERPTPILYKPFAQHVNTAMSLIAETTSADPVALAQPLRELVRGLDVNQPVFNVRTLASLYEGRAMGGPLLVMRTVTAMGLLGLTLALVGLYGLVAYSVACRTREIGLRMAMGAAKTDVLKMVLRQGLMLSLAGIGVGVLVSAGVSGLIAAGTAGMGAPSPATYVIVPVLLICSTLAASYVPARRAATVDPLRALRDE